LNSPQDERRRFFRIDDSLSLSYRQIPPDSLPDSVECLENELDSDFTVISSLASVSQQMAGTLHKIESSRPEIAAYLKSLDRKIDILGRALLAQTTDLLERPAQAVNLSATGISFAVADYIRPGSMLELKMLLMPSYAGILTFAEVVGCDPVESEPGQSVRVFNLRTTFAQIRRSRELQEQRVRDLE
jgi:hypothetical protein